LSVARNDIRERIEAFLKQKRLAVVGVSREPEDFTRGLFRESCRCGYDVVRVNPNLSEVEGRVCYHRVQDVALSVEGVLFMTSPAAAEQVVRDSVDAGIHRVYVQGSQRGSREPERD
jgi:predicted CoA-binding protein